LETVSGKESPAAPPRVPHDFETEKALLSAMMCSSAAAKGVFGAGITEDDFFHVRNVELFGVFRKLADEGKPLDYPLIASRCVNDEAVYGQPIPSKSASLEQTGNITLRFCENTQSHERSSIPPCDA
jgi:replicative DNA helicase